MHESEDAMYCKGPCGIYWVTSLSECEGSCSNAIDTHPELGWYNTPFLTESQWTLAPEFKIEAKQSSKLNSSIWPNHPRSFLINFSDHVKSLHDLEPTWSSFDLWTVSTPCTQYTTSPCWNWYSWTPSLNVFTSANCQEQAFWPEWSASRSGSIKKRSHKWASGEGSQRGLSWKITSLDGCVFKRED